MAALNIPAAEVALKQLVKDELIQQYEDEINVSKQIKKADDPSFVNGKGYRIPSKFYPPTGHGYGGDGMAFNTPNNWTLQDMYVYPVQYAMPGRITGRTIRNFKDASSLVKGMSDLMTHYNAAAAKDREVGVFNDGTGRRGTIKTSSGSTITFLSAPTDTPTSGFGTTKGAVPIWPGESYDVIDGTAGTVRAGSPLVVASRDSNVQITTVSAVDGSWIANDYVVYANSLNNHFRGLAHLVNNDSSVVQLISRSANPLAKSPVIDLNGANCTTSTVTKLKALLRGRGGAKTALNCVAFLSIALEELLLRQGHNLRRYDPSERTLDISFDSFAVGATVFTSAVDCDEDRAYFLDLSQIHWYEEMPYGPYDLDGNILRMVPGSAGNGTDAYYFAIGWAGNMGVESFNKHALIKRASVVDAGTQASSYA
jgi:hypothetical protein